MRLWQIDSFTQTVFRGNPAGVCLLDQPADPQWMQAVASEMNVSETAFFWPMRGSAPAIASGSEPDSTPVFAIRFFTPTQEVPICGHATLASAFAWFHLAQASGDRPGARPPTLDAARPAAQSGLRFEAAGGTLLCRPGDPGEIVMDFPAAKTVAVPVLPRYASLLVGAGGVQAEVGEPLAAARYGDWLLLELRDVAAVRGAKPDLAALTGEGHGHLILTARAGGQPYDIASRVFAPGAGIPEDPVTGFAHTVLAPYYGAQGVTGKLRCRQVSRRGGDLCAEWRGDRVMLWGHAVLAYEAELAQGPFTT